jgi:hypothetical protein
MAGVIEEGKRALEKDKKGHRSKGVHPDGDHVGNVQGCQTFDSNLEEELNAAKKITAARAPIMKQSAREP